MLFVSVLEDLDYSVAVRGADGNYYWNVYADTSTVYTDVIKKFHIESNSTCSYEEMVEDLKDLRDLIEAKMGACLIIQCGDSLLAKDYLSFVQN